MSLWDDILQLRRENKIPLEWNAADLKRHLLNPESTLRSVPPNRSISRDGSAVGDYVKKGSTPKAWRVGPPRSGLYRLIEDPSNDEATQRREFDRVSSLLGGFREPVHSIGKVPPSIDDLIDTLTHKLPVDRLKKLSENFSYPKGEGTLSEIGSIYREQKYLTLSQAYRLVEWKTDRQKTRFLKGNTEAKVRELTKRAAQDADISVNLPDTSATKLNQLRGVHFPTASVFLTAWDSDAFGIIDIRTWSALFRLTEDGFFNRGKRTLFNAQEFRLYTLLLRKWSMRLHEGISPRTIDKALWQYDKTYG